MTSYLTGTEILKEEEDLGTFHPKQMQCDRPDEGNELYTLAEEPSGKNEDCTDFKGTEKICNEAEGKKPANEVSNNMLTPTYERGRSVLEKLCPRSTASSDTQDRRHSFSQTDRLKLDLEKSHPEELKIGPLREKEEGCELTEEAWEDNRDCTQLDNSPQPCSEECGDIEGDCDQLNEGFQSESWHICVQNTFSWLWKLALFTILSLLKKGAGTNKNTQIRRPPYDLIVSNSSDGPVTDPSCTIIQELERRIAALEIMQVHSKEKRFGGEKMTPERVQNDSHLKEVNDLKEKMAQYDLHLKEMDDLKEKMAQYHLHLKEMDDLKEKMVQYDLHLKEMDDVKEKMAQYDLHWKEMNDLKEKITHSDLHVKEMDDLKEEIAPNDLHLKKMDDVKEKMAQYDLFFKEMNDLKEKITQNDLHMKEIKNLKENMVQYDLQLKEMDDRAKIMEKVVTRHDSQLKESKNCEEEIHKKMAQQEMLLVETKNHGEITKRKIAQHNSRLKEMKNGARKREAKVTQISSKLQEVENCGEMTKNKIALQDLQYKEMGKRVEKNERRLALHDSQLQDMRNLGEMVKRRMAQDDFLLKEIIHRTERLKEEMAHYNSQLQEMGNLCESMQEKVAQQDSHFKEMSNRADRMKRVLAQHVAHLKELDHHKKRMEKGMRKAAEEMENHYALICMQDEKTVHYQRYFDGVLQQHFNNCRNVETQIRDLIVRIDTLFAVSAPGTPNEV